MNWELTIENESLNLELMESIKILRSNIAKDKTGYRVIAQSPICAWDSEYKSIRSYYCLGEFEEEEEAIAFKNELDKKLGIRGK